jgi:predicted TIM-barrel enzyme
VKGQHGAQLTDQLDAMVRTLDDAHAAGLHLPTITAQCVAGLRVVALVLTGQTEGQEPDAGAEKLRQQHAPAGIIPAGEGAAPCVCGHTPDRHAMSGRCGVRECECFAVDVS